MKKIQELISKQIEDVIIDSILYFFDKNPEDNIQMPQGKPSIVIEQATRQIRIKLSYMDSLKNEYNPIEKAILIDDKRSKKLSKIELPLNIDFIIEVINPLEVCK